MVRQYVVLAILWAATLMESAIAQAPSKIDFGRDVLPIFRQNCVGCHGPNQQMNALRLDRRSSVFKSGLRRVVPGSTENSLLYHRLTGTSFGTQMPPSGALPSAQLNTIKAWIEQGAEWPDALANEANFAPTDAKAVAMVEALRNGDRQGFMKSVNDDLKLLNARGPEGSTPFMYAVLYSDAATLEQLLKRGADPNVKNDAKATPLMWAAMNLEKTRVLLAHGAEVNVMSDDLRTPLMIAAGKPNGAPIVKFLLEHGANANPTKNPGAESSPLIQAAVAADAESMQLLLDHGADLKIAGGPALALAITLQCSKCIDLLVAKNMDKVAYTIALLSTAFLADVKDVQLMLDHGADVNAVDPDGRTPLMQAAISDRLPVDVVKLMVDRGANINAKSQHPRSTDTGQTVLDIAKLNGNTPVVDLLIKSGATGAGPSTPTPILKPVRSNTIQGAIQRSIPLIQRSDASFTAKAGCISCHNDSLAAMAVGAARKNGFRVDEQIAAQQVKANITYLAERRDSLHQGFFAAQAGAEAVGDVFGPVVLSYILVGLDAEHYKADLNTDAVAMYLKSRQQADGHWAYSVADNRPPICLDYIGQTALSMRALQLYSPKVDRADYEKSIQLAAQWLVKAEPKTAEDRVWQLLGLSWAGRDKDAIKKLQRDLVAVQQSDGGWSDIPTRASNAYATGRVLLALQTSGLPISDVAFQRGVQFLLNTQNEDGSWYVKTRALGLQPYFDNGFPYGVDQFISNAGTSWATMALALASRTPVVAASSARSR